MPHDAAEAEAKSPYWTIPEDWQGETAVVIGSGPSLNAAQCAKVLASGFKTIAVNNAAQLAPWAHVLYFCDRKWWGWYGKEPWVQNFTGQIVKGSLDERDCLTDRGMVNILLDGAEGFREERDRAAHGRNSGYVAIHLAAHRGAKKIILIGMDMGFEPGGLSHFFGDHPVESKETVYTRTMLPHFTKLKEALDARNIEVIQATPTTNLTIWPCLKLDKALRT